MQVALNRPGYVAYVAILAGDPPSQVSEVLAEQIMLTSTGQSVTELTPIAKACGQVVLPDKYETYLLTIGGGYSWEKQIVEVAQTPRTKKAPQCCAFAFSFAVTPSLCCEVQG